MTIVTRPQTSVKKDAFERLADRMPPDVADSFSSEQREAIKAALILPQPSAHKIDIRHLFSILGQSYYMVFLLGKDRRAQRRLRATQQQQESSGLGHVVSTGVATTLVAAALISSSYLVASTFRIDLVPQMQQDELVSR